MHKTNAAARDADSGIGPLPLTPIMRWLLERGGSIGASASRCSCRFQPS